MRGGRVASPLTRRLRDPFVVDPLGNVPLFLAALRDVDPARHRRIIVRDLLVALAIMAGFLFASRYLLDVLQESTRPSGATDVDRSRDDRRPSHRSPIASPSAGRSEQGGEFVDQLTRDVLEEQIDLPLGRLRRLEPPRASRRIPSWCLL